ncbi:MAG: Hsp70 family protein, partial [Caldilineales bacterium]|nr:Hsp70 family protein [Caldilineales bacterium]
EVKDVLLLDVTPLSLGVETLGGVMTVMIPRNTTIPTRKTEIFSTAEDGQTAVDIKVLQGERPMARDNKLLGNFRLDGIPPAPRGVPQIEVTFDIDANGILHVTAKDKATGKEQSIKITASTNLDEKEVQRMIREAKEHEREDELRRQLVDARNTADGTIYAVEKALKELGDKVPATERGRIENLIADLKEAMKGEDTARIRNLTEQLQQASYALSQQLYQTRSGPGPNGGSGRRPGGPEEEVVEGDYRQV